MVKNLTANAGDIRDVDSISRSGRSPGEGMATHSTILVWRIPWTEEPGELQSVGPQRVGHVQRKNTIFLWDLQLENDLLIMLGEY